MNKKRVTKASIFGALVFLVAFNLRPTITAVGPLLEDIGAAFDLGETALGLLGSLPLIMFALVSPLTLKIMQRIGPDQTVLLTLVVIFAGILLRSYTNSLGLWVGAALATAAIAIGNVILPVLVGRDYKTRMALATGIYTSTMGLGAAIASGVAVPIAAQTSWRESLAVWAIPALLVAVLWTGRLAFYRKNIPFTVQAAATPVATVDTAKYAPPKSQIFWLTFFMALQSATFYFVVTWLPTIEMSAGASQEKAGMTLFWYQIVGLTTGLLIPILMQRTKNQIPAGILGTVPLIAAYAGFIFSPQNGVIWSLLMGFGSGIALVFTMTLISIWGKTATATAKLSGFVQSIGYLFAAAAPVIAGAIAQKSGNWKAVLTFMLVTAIVQLVIVPFAGRVPTDEAD